MRRSLFSVFTPALSLAVALPFAFAQNEKPSQPKAIAVEPAVVETGKPVTLRWYFTGDKVQVSGGRFGKGVLVTGKTLLTDNPKQTTTYKFDVWYRVPAAGPDGQTIQKPVHVQYTATAQVMKPLKVALKTYRDPYGWQVDHLAGWKVDKERLPDPANNALAFFQQEEDSVERLAVSVLPATQMTASELIEKVERSLTDNYDEVQVGNRADVTHAGASAVLTSFTGMDNAHPGTRTRSLIMAFVKDGRGYVVSARTVARQFDLRRPALERMVRSFALYSKTAKK